MIMYEYDKSYYRTSLKRLKKKVKLGIFADEVGIPRSSLSMFLKSKEFDYQISLDKLERLHSLIVDYFEKNIQ